MMKKQSLLTGILIVFLLAACAPESSATNPPAAATDAATVALPTATLVAPTLESATQPVASEEATVVPLATSRGPELHATDPTNVSLASGGLQFVEFFRFT